MIARILRLLFHRRSPPPPRPAELERHLRSVGLSPFPDSKDERDGR